MKKNLIYESLSDLKRFKRIINEAYGDMGMQQDPRMTQQQGYDDEMGMSGDDMGDDEEMMQQDPRMAQQQSKVDPKKMSNHEKMEHSMNDDDEMNEGEEENPIANDGQMRNIIDQIRELAIQGIAQYADNVEDCRYISLKRIWMETDKFYESFISDDKKKK